MVIFDSVRGFFEAIIAPLNSVFNYFPDLRNIITGICVLSLGYFGWRAVK